MHRQIFIIFILLPLVSFSQTYKIEGYLKNAEGKPIAGASVFVKQSGKGAISDNNGYFNFRTKGGNVTLVVKAFNYLQLDTMFFLEKNVKMSFVLKSSAYQLDAVEATAKSSSLTGAITISEKEFTLVPSASGSPVETLIKTSMGVQSNNELSSQYNVRGGNFDENLVYVNGIQVYRPVLIHSGQQEGLSLLNPDMVKALSFYAGGYEAKFDDKMSSALDVKYKFPDSNRVKLTLGLINSRVYLAKVSKNRRFKLALGARFKQNSYLLKSLDTKGNYKPRFFDLQLLSRYSLSRRITIDYYSYWAYNSYNFYPTSSTVAFGTFSDALQMSILYDGQEKDLYISALNALTFGVKFSENAYSKFIFSSYISREEEKYTFLAAYSLNKVDEEFYSESFGDSLVNIGVGAFLDYTRNYLNVRLYTAENKTTVRLGSHNFEFGIKARYDQISQSMLRWYYIDSAGYSFSLGPDKENLQLYEYATSDAAVNSGRFSAYLQDNFGFYAGNTQVKVSAGGRYTFWQYAQEHLFSPRVNILLTPSWTEQWSFRIAGGLYYQVPFFREMLNFEGQLTAHPHSQRSVHFVAGAYRNFEMWQRPFKFTSELYYKKMDNLIPYEIDNLRIQYYADLVATGYAAGADFRLYGQFVEGVDSWFSLSFMKTAEDIAGDSYWQLYDKYGNPTELSSQAVDSVFVEPGYLARPSDQRVSFGLFFQDYMPGNEDFRVSLSLFYGSGRPFGPPQKGRQYALLRTKPFLRADLGFSYDISRLFNGRKASLQFDLLNIFDYRNIASYSWLTVLGNTAVAGSPDVIQIAVPNYLTGRMFNISLNIKF